MKSHVLQCQAGQWAAGPSACACAGFTDTCQPGAKSVSEQGRPKVRRSLGEDIKGLLIIVFIAHPRNLAEEQSRSEPTKSRPVGQRRVNPVFTASCVVFISTILEGDKGL